MNVIKMLGVLVLVANCAHQSATNGHFAGATESERLNSFLEEAFKETISLFPEEQTYLGMATGRDRLNDYSIAFEERIHALRAKHLEILEGFAEESLTEQARLSYKLFKVLVEQEMSDHQWRTHYYPVTPMRGIHAQLPSFLINLHQVKNEQDVKDYLARLQGIPQALADTLAKVERSEQAGVIPPRVIIDQIIDGSKKIITGQPFAINGVDSPLLADFKAKVAGLKGLNSRQKEAYVKSARTTLQDAIKPAYDLFIARFSAQRLQASEVAGVWRFASGDDFYSHELRKYTTTDYSPDFVHRLGLLNVDRIHGEMNGIINQVGFKGNLQDFFKYMKTNPKFYFSQTESGRGQYLKLATAYIDNMRSHLDTLFYSQPKSALTIKPVEAYRERSGGSAFYEGPAPDGSRPGTYYVNLSNLKAMPRWEAESLAYHEGIPGHHMQVSLAQEMESLPRFRRFNFYSSHGEGWALYAERIPKEIGMYKDPYSDFGRLAAELFRACRLVVDTGIHSKKWTRDQAIKYFNENTPNDPAENSNQVDRYISWPGQATAYMVGMLKILELRRRSQLALGKKFDLRQFHDVVLKNGSVPLSILEDLVKQYVEGQGASWSQPQNAYETRQ